MFFFLTRHIVRVYLLLCIIVICNDGMAAVFNSGGFRGLGGLIDTRRQIKTVTIYSIHIEYSEKKIYKPLKFLRNVNKYFYTTSISYY